MSDNDKWICFDCKKPILDNAMVSDCDEYGNYYDEEIYRCVKCGFYEATSCCRE